MALKDLGPSGGGWGNWQELVADARYHFPRTAIHADGRQALIALDQDRFLIYMHELQPGGDWSAPQRFGGPFYDSQITANEDGRLEIFARGMDLHLMHRWESKPNGPWSGWDDLGPEVNDLQVGRNWDGRLEVFVRGKGNVPQHRYQTAPNNGWSGWVGMPGQLVHDQRVILTADGRLEWFIVDENSNLCHSSQGGPNNGWSDWQNLGGTDTIEVARNEDGRLEAFGTLATKPRHIYETSPGGPWSGWVDFDGNFHFLKVGSNLDGRLEIVGLRTDFSILHRWQNAPNSGWSGWTDLNRHDGRELILTQNVFGELQMFVITQGYQLITCRQAQSSVIASSSEGIHAAQQDSLVKLQQANKDLVPQVKTRSRPDKFAELLNEAEKIPGFLVGFADSVDKDVGDIFSKLFDKAYLETLVGMHLAANTLERAGTLEDLLGDEFSHLIDEGERALSRKLPVNTGKADVLNRLLNLIVLMDKLASATGAALPVAVDDIKKRITDTINNDVLPEHVLALIAGQLNVITDESMKQLESAINSIAAFAEKSGDNPPWREIPVDVLKDMAIALAVLRVVRALINIVPSTLPLKLKIGINLSIGTVATGRGKLEADVGIGGGAGVEADVPLFGVGGDAEGGAGNVTLLNLKAIKISLTTLLIGPIIVLLDFGINSMDALITIRKQAKWFEK